VTGATKRLHDSGHEAVHTLQTCNRLRRRACVRESSGQATEVRVDVDRDFKQ
jgi:hypothetical protein